MIYNTSKQTHRRLNKNYDHDCMRGKHKKNVQSDIFKFGKEIKTAFMIFHIKVQKIYKKLRKSLIDSSKRNKFNRRLIFS